VCDDKSLGCCSGCHCSWKWKFSLFQSKVYVVMLDFCSLEQDKFYPLKLMNVIFFVSFKSTSWCVHTQCHIAFYRTGLHFYSPPETV
jgi:hypothetical protein